MIWLRVDLPFWRATSTITVRNRRLLSGSSSSMWIRSHRCQGSRSTSSTVSANSMTEKPSEVSGVRLRSGGVKIRGVSDP
jgi:hypothetical protein